MVASGLPKKNRGSHRFSDKIFGESEPMAKKMKNIYSKATGAVLCLKQVAKKNLKKSELCPEGGTSDLNFFIFFLDKFVGI